MVEAEKLVYIVSIHAPARGATSQLKVFLRGLSFNPRSCARSDAALSGDSSYKTAFQSTLLREERQITREMNLPTSTFQSTLLREERQRQEPAT